MKKIFVTKPYLPPKEELSYYYDKIYNSGVLTNDGPLAKELTAKLQKICEVQHFNYVTNGTIALQLALRVLGITSGEVITTPFTYVATISSILWEHCVPVFVDIEPDNFTIDAKKIEEAITEETKAIMPVHVFGYACDVDSISSIAKENNLYVIYDAAHTFGARYKGKALCSYGDISTLSFHATKLFHTIEGGACLTNDDALSFKLEWMRRFGHCGDNHMMLGLNAKQDEFNAAMGLANLAHIDFIIQSRKQAFNRYIDNLGNKYKRPKVQDDLEYNYAYFPILFDSESELEQAMNNFITHDIYPRRYFYPSCNELQYLKKKSKCKISEDISRRILCLPLWSGMSNSIIDMVCELL